MLELPASYRALQRQAHDARHADPGADIHLANHDQVFNDAQPGTPDFAERHLVGSSAPERHIERWDGVGPEGFGPVEILDGRTGRSIAKVNAAARRRMMA